MVVPIRPGLILPREILENIAFEVAAADPLGPPTQLLPLLQTNKAIHEALAISSHTPLWSRICKLKFDTGAVRRRARELCRRDYNGHLIQMCQLLRVLRHGDIYHEDAEDQFVIAYCAMLDNDGKNRAQLEAAGIVDFLDRFMRERLFEGRASPDIWPVEDAVTASVLWLKWMFSTRERLLQETPEQRAEVTRLVFPFLACPHRYTSALAPPNHFLLPLGSANPVQREIYQMQTAHYPYPHYYTHDNASRYLQLYYFRSNTVLTTPLIAPAAALLFWSRRELNGLFEVPAVLPAARNPPGRLGLTQEDIHEVNAHKVARLPAAVVWDWERGGPACIGGDGAVRAWRDDDSARWDIDWYRARLCHSVFSLRRFRPGPGLMRKVRHLLSGT